MAKRIIKLIKITNTYSFPLKSYWTPCFYMEFGACNFRTVISQTHFWPFHLYQKDNTPSEVNKLPKIYDSSQLLHKQHFLKYSTDNSCKLWKYSECINWSLLFEVLINYITFTAPESRLIPNCVDVGSGEGGSGRFSRPRKVQSTLFPPSPIPLYFVERRNKRI
jgi:hypothetical protein